LSLIRPSDHVFTGVHQPQGERERLVGQIHQSPRVNSAHINYLLITEESEPEELVVLLEGLIKQAGHWGAKQVIVDLESQSDLFPYFRQVGFSVLAKQRIYKCQPLDPNLLQVEHGWRIWRNEDIQSMRRLYMTVVPPLIQPIEPLTRREMLGLVYYDTTGSLQAYADLVYGPKGAWALPIVHPQIDVSISDLLLQLVNDLPDRNGRPIYVASRSYQPWVEQALETLDVESGPEQAMMIRYLALRQRVGAEFAFSSVENGKPEPTLPLAPIKRQKDV